MALVVDEVLQNDAAGAALYQFGTVRHRLLKCHLTTYPSGGQLVTAAQVGLNTLTAIKLHGPSEVGSAGEMPAQFGIDPSNPARILARTPTGSEVADSTDLSSHPFIADFIGT